MDATAGIETFTLACVDLAPAAVTGTGRTLTSFTFDPIAIAGDDLDGATGALGIVGFQLGECALTDDNGDGTASFSFLPRPPDPFSAHGPLMHRPLLPRTGEGEPFHRR